MEDIKKEEAEEASSRMPRGKRSTAYRVWRFYADGFRNMTVGKTLWAIILIKLFIMFFILKLFFFPNILQRDYSTDEERSEAVRNNLTKERQ